MHFLNRSNGIRDNRTGPVPDNFGHVVDSFDDGFPYRSTSDLRQAAHAVHLAGVCGVRPVGIRVGTDRSARLALVF